MARAQLEGVHRQGRAAGRSGRSDFEIRHPPPPEHRDRGQQDSAGQPVS